MLKSIYIVTLLVLSVTRSEQAYEQNLDYQTVARGEVSAELATAWRAPASAGAPGVLMQPDSASDDYLRFVQAEARGNYEPMKSLGWNAVEIQAQDPDRLAVDLDPERFQVIGEPAFLTGKQNIRAMQALGPDRELLYLTHVIDPAASTFRIGTAQSWVDRVFIMVLGTSDLAATTAFYQDWLGQDISGPWPYRVRVLSRAWGKPDDTLYDLSIAQLEEDFLIEIDQYPAEAPRREPSDLGLPFGPAMVSFRVGSLEQVARRTGRAPLVVHAAPYGGQAMLLLEGPSGELIELVGPAPR
jgi:catechol 2,3-dioxygenase-like lactoylglutathione lyase family enzyme